MPELYPIHTLNPERERIVQRLIKAKPQLLTGGPTTQALADVVMEEAEAWKSTLDTLRRGYEIRLADERKLADDLASALRLALPGSDVLERYDGSRIVR